MADPSTDAHVNVGGTAAVLEAARADRHAAGDPRLDRRRLRRPGAAADREDAPIAPLSPYGASKAAAETYMQLFERLHGLSTLALRMANVYGPRQDPHGEAGVVAIFTGAAREGRSATSTATARRRATTSTSPTSWPRSPRPADATATGVLNVSTGSETSVAELAAGARRRDQLRPGRAGEIGRSCLDPTRARERARAGARAVTLGRRARKLRWRFPRSRCSTCASTEEDVAGGARRATAAAG